MILHQEPFICKLMWNIKSFRGKYDSRISEDKLTFIIRKLQITE